jgi:hypothetical protein
MSDGTQMACFQMIIHFSTEKAMTIITYKQAFSYIMKIRPTVKKSLENVSNMVSHLQGIFLFITVSKPAEAHAASYPTSRYMGLLPQR